MKFSRGFNYELQPVLLTRQWSLDTVLLELKTANGELARLQAEDAAIDADVLRVAAQWRADSQASGHFRIDTIALLTRYMQDLTTRKTLKAREIADAETARDALVEQVATEQRGVEAIEKHRDQCHDAYARQLAGIEYKTGDEQWLALQTHKESI